MIKRILFGLCIAAGIVSCRPELDTPRYNSGDADFTRFVAVGGTQVSGYNDGALTLTSQQNSIPAILAGRFQLAEGGAFNQPYVNPGNGIGATIQDVQGATVYQFQGVLKLESYTNCKQEPDIRAVMSAYDPSSLNYIGNSGPYNNLAVPHVKSFQLYSQQLGRTGATGNPFYVRFASDTGATTGLSSTILEEAVEQNPTFFMLWIGNNDVFAYGASGGSGLTSGLGTYDITPEDTFANAIDNIVNSLTGNRAKGVIGNLPDLTSIPFYTVIPWNGLNLTQTEADYWNTQVLPGSGIVFKEGANGFVYSNGTGISQMKEGELVTLRASLDSIRCFEMGTPQRPLRANVVLDSSEVSVIRAKIHAFNDKIRSVAVLKNLALADMNAYYKTIQSGLLFNGNNYQIDYLTGGLFSIDGALPSSRGYALIANVFIEAINAKYKSNLPPADVNSYPGIKLP